MAWWGFGLVERVWCHLLGCIHFYIAVKLFCSALTVSFFGWTLAKFLFVKDFGSLFLLLMLKQMPMRLCVHASIS